MGYMEFDGWYCYGVTNNYAFLSPAVENVGDGNGMPDSVGLYGQVDASRLDRGTIGLV